MLSCTPLSRPPNGHLNSGAECKGTLLVVALAVGIKLLNTLFGATQASFSFLFSQLRKQISNVWSEPTNSHPTDQDPTDNVIFDAGIERLNAHKTSLQSGFPIGGEPGCSR